MVTGRLSALNRELQSLQRRTFLSTREKRRLETIHRQIPEEQSRLALILRRHEERVAKTLERQQRAAESRWRRKIQRQQQRVRNLRKTIAAVWSGVPGPSTPTSPVVRAPEQKPQAPEDPKIYHCKLCGRSMRGKRGFCTKQCRRAARSLPSPDRIREECEKIASQWSSTEMASRSGYTGSSKWRVAAEIIERCGRRIPHVKSTREDHETAYHGRLAARADSDYWNVTPENSAFSETC